MKTTHTPVPPAYLCLFLYSCPFSIWYPLSLPHLSSAMPYFFLSVTKIFYFCSFSTVSHISLISFLSVKISTKHTTFLPDISPGSISEHKTILPLLQRRVQRLPSTISMVSQVEIALSFTSTDMDPRDRVAAESNLKLLLKSSVKNFFWQTLQ